MSDVNIPSNEENLIQIAALLGIDKKSIRVTSGKQEHYRNRMDYAFHPGGLGMRERGKWYKIIDMTSSEVANDENNKLLGEIRAFFKEPDAYVQRKKDGAFKHAVIRTPSLGPGITFILNKDASKLKEAKEKIVQFSKTTSANNVVIGYVGSLSGLSISDEIEVVKGSEFLFETLNEKKFMFHSQGFFQTDTEIAEKMVYYIEEICKTSKKQTLLDFYGGVGVFGISCAKHFKDVFVVESFAPAIKSARENAQSNSVKNVTAEVLDMKDLGEISSHFGKPRDLLVILDPPRCGMHPMALKSVQGLGADKIVYVSCNFKQLAIELPSFLQVGYKLSSLAFFDMFPKTGHSEIVVTLDLIERGAQAALEYSFPSILQ